ncbi:MAG: aminotransferase class V-fold PLP-dependent enzyme [Acholeplasmataceae bacterium]|nr:aminotransferase class V-fold PLP-dependent enzyme [Acholeplasmataceae bacterium]
MKDHNKTPYLTKLKEYAERNITPFDVPGHKLGRLRNDLTDYVGEKIYKLDANAPRGLDTLSRPTGVIKEAQELMADAYNADKAYFMINGTSGAIIAMIMASVKANEKIILPRNVHKSVISALIFSGAVPVFVKPDIDHNLGIANGMSYEGFLEALEENPDAKAVLIINPTYFGVTSNIVKITKKAHEHGLIVMADEAHGAQFYFSDELPISAMAAGCDLSALSVHKTASSLTQSSVLLLKGDRVDEKRLQSTINLIQSTSPSSILMASLEASRKEMVLDGKEGINKVLKLKKKYLKKLKEIPKIEILDLEYAKKRGFPDFDPTKLVIKVSNLGITGFQAYRILFDKYSIQLELAETYLILGIITKHTIEEDFINLISALKEIAKKYKDNEPLDKIKFKYSFPNAFIRPRVAYHAPFKVVKLEDAENEISAESVMIYPPGIPMLIPGEYITRDFIEDLLFYEENGSVIFSETSGYIKVVDKEKWIKGEDYL